ncbi:hypothetical protein BGW41_007465, partial [Actinomortierella wolfii]
VYNKPEYNIHSTGVTLESILDELKRLDRAVQGITEQFHGFYGQIQDMHEQIRRLESSNLTGIASEVGSRSCSDTESIISTIELSFEDVVCSTRHPSPEEETDP